MKHITDVHGLQLQNTAIALGKFDGFHRGHQLLLRQVGEWQAQGMTGVIFTFRFPENKRGRLIDSAPEKLHKAEMSGIQVFLEYPFTQKFADQTPDMFVRKILVDQLHVKAVAIGTDYHFGKNRSGDADTMKRLGDQYGFTVAVFEKLTCRNEEISSTSIRDGILQGDMEFVAEAMGKGYSIYGEVIHGAGLGHTIGIPTINQRIAEDKLLPPYGVYLARCHMDGTILHGIANLGCKPTVSDACVAGLETYLFEYEGNAYGKNVEVELLHYIRKEMQFENVDDLLDQMHKDIQYAKNML